MSIKGLRYLDLGCPRISGAGLAKLGETHVFSLVFVQTQVTGAQRTAVAELQQLDRVRFIDARMEKPDLAHLGELKNLRNLTLRGNAVPYDWLVQVGRMGALEKLHLYMTRVSEAGVSDLKFVLPKLVIDRGDASPFTLGLENQLPGDRSRAAVRQKWKMQPEIAARSMGFWIRSGLPRS